MAKFTAEDKWQAVLRYLTGKESSIRIASSLETDKKAVLKWVIQYEYNGVEAFVKRYTNYTQQFKLDVLNYMIGNGTSLLETTALFNIAIPSTIGSWRKQVDTQGIDALQSKKKGGPSMKNESTPQPKQVSAEGSREALEARIKQLEMENA